MRFHFNDVFCFFRRTVRLFQWRCGFVERDFASRRRLFFVVWAIGCLLGFLETGDVAAIRSFADDANRNREPVAIERENDIAKPIPTESNDLPFWNDFPKIVQTSETQKVFDSGASVVMNGIASDPCWGIFSQRMQAVRGIEQTRLYFDAGLKVIVWFEGFGTTQANVALLQKDESGNLTRDPSDASLPVLLKNHWAWDSASDESIRSNELCWIGIADYFNDEPRVRPWTRTHSRFGCVPATYPDGRIAEGFNGSSDDPRNARFFDATCSKDVLGRVAFDYHYNRGVNRISPETKKPVGPLDGLLKIDDVPVGVPDPGFSPEEWRELKKVGYSGLFDAGKDSACPIWLEYLKASVRQAAEIGVDGLWVDNFSAWDSFHAKPILKAFGDWSVVGFAEYLRRRLECGSEISSAEFDWSNANDQTTVARNSNDLTNDLTSGEPSSSKEISNDLKSNLKEILNDSKTNPKGISNNLKLNVESETKRNGWTADEWESIPLKAFCSNDRLETFDVRRYLQEKCREFGGDPERLDDPRWADDRWLDDPVWRAYLVYKRRVGTKALSEYYRICKEIARKSGKQDFLICGNDIPGFSLGWPRGELDLVSSELSWDWSLTGGPRGFMPPPIGSFVPTYRLAREHAKGRFVNFWFYASKEEDRPNVAKVVYYQALANHATPLPMLGDGTLGSMTTDVPYFAFLDQVRPYFAYRKEVPASVGLFYSSSDQLMEMVPGGFRDHSNQPHSFAFNGWGTALSQSQIPWRAIPEWKLSPDSLKTLAVLVLPEVQILERNQIALLADWSNRGGRLIIDGSIPSRRGELENFRKIDAAERSEIERLFRNADWIDGRLGLSFYLKDQNRSEELEKFRSIVERSFKAASDDGKERSTPRCETEPDFPWQVGTTLYFVDSSKEIPDYSLDDPFVSRKRFYNKETGETLEKIEPLKIGDESPGGASVQRLFLDVNNTQIDLTTDRIEPVKYCRLKIVLPKDLSEREETITVFSPDDLPPTVRCERSAPDELLLTLSDLEVYASVMIDFAEPERSGKNDEDRN